MLELINIRKTYGKDESAVEALKGVSIKFRRNEFVSILGQSGCGKTTMLNIIGGLDHYTSGDLIINGVSTKNYKDANWDTYRNHSIGFIFQSYNLIPHQSVLGNVELALTLSGVSKKERRRRAVQALAKVGLRNQIHKRPNQLSGGQMQRVAIARALINNPDILLADEPTGALDSETSVQVMELLKDIAKDKLVIMVTHNPELAEQYSTRIVRLFDGNVVDDTDPFDGVEVEETKKEEVVKKKKKASMSFFTALSLSFHNLMTKKGRTFLTSFAGSIGIIGIALILSVSTGVNAYIQSIEENTMSSYPIGIYQSSMDMGTMMGSMMQKPEADVDRDPNKIYSSDIMIPIMESMTSSVKQNDLSGFRNYIESTPAFKDCTTEIKYSYSADLNTYLEMPDGTYKNSSEGMDNLYSQFGMSLDMMAGMTAMMTSMGSVTGWTELVGGVEHVEKDYLLVDGRYPENSNEIVLIVDKDNQISDYTLYVLGIRDFTEIEEYLEHAIQAMINGTENTYEIEPTEYTYDEIYGYNFKVMLDSDNYILENGIARKLNPKLTKDAEIIQERLDKAEGLKIVGILSPRDETMAQANIGTIGYMSALMMDVIDRSNASDVIQAQLNNREVDVFTGIRFDEKGYTVEDFQWLISALDRFPVDENYLNRVFSMIGYLIPGVEENLRPIIDEYIHSGSKIIVTQIVNYLNQDKITTNTYEGNLKALGYVDKSNPSSILMYPKDFESKDKLTALIKEYNDSQPKDKKITYSDTVALLISSVSTIVNAISYVLIAFVAISLVVSSIMIGIITYISVLERTKEIGILRAVGASKRDIARVFNAETLFVGFVAGAIGIIVSLGLIVIINIILLHFTGIRELQAMLEPKAAVILVLISMILTFIAGLFPARTASNKDPVIALRSE